jgi:hypothetical protein
VGSITGGAERIAHREGSRERRALRGVRGEQRRGRWRGENSEGSTVREGSTKKMPEKLREKSREGDRG